MASRPLAGSALKAAPVRMWAFSGSEEAGGPEEGLSSGAEADRNQQVKTNNRHDRHKPPLFWRGSVVDPRGDSRLLRSSHELLHLLHEAEPEDQASSPMLLASRVPGKARGCTVPGAGCA